MITVLYSCKKCGIVDRPVQVPAREHQDIDVVHWMQNIVARSVSIDHQQVSPSCIPDTLSDIKVPIADSEFIGQQIE